MADCTKPEALRTEITQLMPIEKTVDEAFLAFAGRSAAAASSARAAGQLGEDIRRREAKSWEAECGAEAQLPGRGCAGI